MTQSERHIDLPEMPLPPLLPPDDEPSKYEYMAALRYRDGVQLERYGVSFNDEDYPDAKARAMGEVWDGRRDPNVPEVVLMRRPIGEWEITTEETT